MTIYNPKFKTAEFKTSIMTKGADLDQLFNEALRDMKLPGQYPFKGFSYTRLQEKDSDQILYQIVVVYAV